MQVDLTECWGDAGRGLAAAAPSSYPKELVLRLQVRAPQALKP